MNSILLSQSSSPFLKQPRNEKDYFPERVKQLAFQSMVTAWDNYDFCLEYKQNHQWSKMLESLFASIYAAIESVTILYSASLESPGNTDLMKHLMREEDCFSSCHPNFFENFEYWTNNRKLLVNEHGLASDFKIFVKQVEDFLESIEQYYFRNKRRLYYTSFEQRLRHHKQKLLMIGILSLFFILVGLYPVFQYLHPTQVFQTKGQFFWTSDEINSESEEHSLNFEVKEDGKFHEYSLEMFSPLALKTLRFDPVQEKNADIIIDHIEYYIKDVEQPVLIQTFDDSETKWKANHHIDKFKVKNGVLFFHSLKQDPFIRQNIEFSALVKIKVRMKVILYKNYVQWIFS